MKIAGFLNVTPVARPRLARAAGLLLASALAIATFGPLARAGSPDDSADRARAVIESGITALGGASYQTVTSIYTAGNYTQYDKGRPTMPSDFTDTIVLPDRDRTEFGKKKNRIVQANAGDAGWKYDGPRSLLSEQSSEDVRQFKLFVRATLDNLLRSGWRAPGTKLTYVGRTELQPRVWAETVAVEYADGLRVEVFFDAASKLPAATRYRDRDTGSVLEARYHTYLEYEGVQVPRFVDLFRDGMQTARILNDTVKLNPTVAAGFFDMPSDAKSLAK